MRNLIAYFGAKPDCNQYVVKIISDESLNTFDEIYLAGESPFVVSYDQLKTPFEPIMSSRASINVVASDYLLDIFSNSAQGTKVKLEDASGNTLWYGFLTSNLLNQSQNNCGYETFTLEAQDCLYILDKLDYELVGEKKAIVTFQDIIAQIANRAIGINNLYIDNCLFRENGTSIDMRDLKISEQNFFSSDSDDPWTLKEVLEELCRYLGFTAVQYKDSIYLYSVQFHANQTWEGTGTTQLQMNVYTYSKSNSFASPISQGTNGNLAQAVTLRQDIVRGTGSDISLETIYNKAQVKDSFYEVDHFIPDLWEDELLTNRQGEFWKCNQISYSGKLKFMNKKGKEKEEEKDENEHIYYLRKFDHENYESIYRDPQTLAVTTAATQNGIYITNVEPNYYVDYNNPITYQGETWYKGYYTIKATFHNTTSSQKTIHISSDLNYQWFDSEEWITDYESGHGELSFTLAKSGNTNSVSSITLTVSAESPSRYTATFNYGADYYIGNASSTRYPITEGQDDKSKKYVGATIVDLATFDRPMDNTNYLYETESNINFDRYLMIRQANKPDRQHPLCEWNFTSDLNPLTPAQTYSTFPPIFRLKAGYTNPVIYDEKAYLALDANAIFERYDREYINPDWTDENTNMNGLGLFRKMASITTVTPALIFSLRVGDKYWSSSSNTWTTTQGAFVVKLGTDKTDEDNVDFTGWWNEEHPVLNNISWTDWAGCKGYKIPLDPSLDMNQDIVFQIHMPSKMQVFKTTGASGSGINSMCWVKDLKIDFTTKGSENYDLADVLYENVIDSGSVNTLSDITCRFTTYPDEGMHSYSNVGLDSGLLKKINRGGLDDLADVPEVNILKTYTNQYSYNTIKQTMTLVDSIPIFSRIKDPTLDGKYFCIAGTEIDYANGSQRLLLIETRPWQNN